MSRRVYRWRAAPPPETGIKEASPAAEAEGTVGDVSRKKKQAPAAVELAAVLLATAAAFTWGKRAALIERGYAACGGEYMLLLIPAIYYTGKRVLLDWLTEFRELWRNGRPWKGGRKNGTV